MFIDLFGKEYKRNPNLIDTNFSIDETNTILAIVTSETYTSEETTLLVMPLVEKLASFDKEFLLSELTFIKELFKNSIETLTSYDVQTIYNIIAKIYRYTSKENINKERAKAEY